MNTQPSAQASQMFKNNPFVGLRPFNSDESLLFFGRQEQAVELMQKLHRTRLLGVVGSSGCGKSSLIRAGLIPKLKAGFLVEDRDRWRIAMMKPGQAPMRNLAVALIDAATDALNPAVPVVLEESEIAALVKSLRRAGGQAAIDYLSKTLAELDANLLLLIDQFEELFHFGVNSGDPEKRDEAADFVSVMLELAEQRAVPIYVVMTMRSDYLGECDNFYGLPEALNRSQYLVPRLTRGQRQQAIEGPIRLYGQKITPRLVDRVLNDAGDQSDQLPVMQHALMRTWDNWRRSGDPIIDSSHYDEAGAIERALSNDADQALAGMSAEELKTTKLIFQALTNVDGRNRLVRRPTRLSVLQKITGADRAQIEKIITRFHCNGRSFLNFEDDLLSDDPLVNISHESLIRQWKKMRHAWLKDEADSREIYVRLAEAAARYEADRAPGRLWRDPELGLALKWYDKRQPNEAWAQRYHPGFQAALKFLDESRAQEEADAAAEKLRQDKELADAVEREQMRRQQLRRSRIFSIFLTLAFLCSLWAVNYARQQSSLAQEEARKALAAEEKARQAEKATNEKNQALELAQKDLKKSFASLEQAKVKEMQARERLQVQLQENTKLVARLSVQNTELERQKNEALVAKTDALKSAEEARKQGAISAQRFAQLLALHSNLESGKDPDRGALLAIHALRTKDLEGKSPITLESDQAARRMMNLITRTKHIKKIDHYSNGATFIRGADLLAAMTTTKEVQLRESVTGQIVNVSAERPDGLIKTPDGAIKFVASPDGKYLATLRTVDQSTDELNKEDGRKLYEVQVQEAAQGALVGNPLRFSSNGDGIVLLFSSDSDRLAVADVDQAQLWEFKTGRQIRIKLAEAIARPAVEDVSIDCAFSPNGKALALLRSGSDREGNPHSEIHFWDPLTGQKSESVITADVDPNGRRRIFKAVAYSPDHKHLATISSPSSSLPAVQNKLELRAVDNPSAIIDEASNLPDFKQLIFNAKGTELALLTANNSIVRFAIVGNRISDRDGKEIVRIRLLPLTSIYVGKALHAIAFSREGKELIVVGSDGEVAVSESQAAAARVSLEMKTQAMSFNEEGKLLATDAEGRMLAWDAKTGEQSVSRFEHPESPVPQSAILGEGGKFAAAIGETVKVWNVDRRQIVKQLNDPIKFAALSPNADYLALVGADGVGWGFTSNSTAPVKLTKDGAKATAMAVSSMIRSSRQPVRQMRQVAVSDQDGAVQITEIVYDNPGASAGNTAPQIQHGGKVSAMLFGGTSTQGNRFLATAGDAVVKIWDAETGAAAGSPLAQTARVKEMIFSPKKNLLAVACQDGKILVWVRNRDLTWTLKRTLDLMLPVEKVSFDPSEEFIAAAGGGMARVWNTETWEPTGGEINVGEVVDVSLAGDKENLRLRVASADKMLRVWKVANGEPLGAPTRYASESKLAYFNSTNLIVVAGSAAFPVIWDLDQKSGWRPNVEVSRDGKYLIGEYRNALVVQPVDQQRKQVFPLLRSSQWSFTPGGNLAVIAVNPSPGPDEPKSLVNIFDAASGNLIQSAAQGRTEWISLAFSPNGETLALLGQITPFNQKIFFWKNGALDDQTISLDQRSNKLSFSPDGAFLFVTGERIGGQLWEVATRRKVSEMGGRIARSSFSRDGKLLAIDFENRVEVLLRHPQEMAEDLCSRMKRNLTYEEWGQYFKDPEKNQLYELTCPGLKPHQSAIDEAVRLAVSEEGKEEAKMLFKILLKQDEQAAEAELEWHSISAQKLIEINRQLTWSDLLDNQREQYINNNEAEVRKKLESMIAAFDAFNANYRRDHRFDPISAIGAEQRGGGFSAASLLNSLCWYGSLMGYERRVETACEIAVKLDSRSTGIIDSRGVNQALLGKYDQAIADLNSYARSTNDPQHRTQRRAWIKALEQCRAAGQEPSSCRQFPLTPEALKSIRGQ